MSSTPHYMSPTHSICHPHHLT